MKNVLVESKDESLSKCQRGEYLRGESRRHPEKEVNIVSTYIAKRTELTLFCVMGVQMEPNRPCLPQVVCVCQRSQEANFL
jgi:hypothetical protein